MKRSTLIPSLSLIAGVIVIVFQKLEEETVEEQKASESRRSVFSVGQEIQTNSNRNRVGRRGSRAWNSARADSLLTSLQELSESKSYGFFYGGEEEFAKELIDLNQRDVVHLLNHDDRIENRYVRDLLHHFTAQHYQFETYLWLREFDLNRELEGDFQSKLNKIRSFLTQSQKDFFQSTSQELSEWLFVDQELDARERLARLSNFSRGTVLYSEWEFGDFISYGSPIATPPIDHNSPAVEIVITESHIEMPIFDSPEFAISRAQDTFFGEDSPEWLRELIQHEITQLQESMEQK